MTIQQGRRPKTIPQFCEHYDISRPTFYAMVRAGTAPRILAPSPRTRLITPVEEDEWLRKHTHEAHEVCNLTGEQEPDE